MLLGLYVSGKLALGAVLAIGMIVALVIYLPVAIVKEVTRSKDEDLPEWMGTVKARRLKLRVLIVVLGVLFAAIAISATQSRRNTMPIPAQEKPPAKWPRALVATVEKLDLEKRELIVTGFTLDFDNQPVLTLKIHEDTRIEYWGGKKLKKGPGVIKKGEEVYLEFKEDGKLESIGRLLFDE